LKEKEGPTYKWPLVLMRASTPSKVGESTHKITKKLVSLIEA
jgi:hypothetical protein